MYIQTLINYNRIRLHDCYIYTCKYSYMIPQKQLMVRLLKRKLYLLLTYYSNGWSENRLLKLWNSNRVLSATEELDRLRNSCTHLNSHTDHQIPGNFVQDQCFSWDINTNSRIQVGYAHKWMFQDVTSSFRPSRPDQYRFIHTHICISVTKLCHIFFVIVRANSTLRWLSSYFDYQFIFYIFFLTRKKFVL